MFATDSSDRSDQGPAVLCRALATLGRASANGSLEVKGGGGRTARIDLERGRIATIVLSGHASLLGDLLLDDGSDASRLVDDSDREEGEPIGRFLLRKGRIDSAALSHALRSQSRKRLRALFEWRALSVRFARRPITSNDGELPSMDDSLVDALRATAPDASIDVLGRELGRERLVLSSFGTDWLRRAALRPEESAVVVLATRGVSFDTLLGLDRRALRFAVALKRVGAIEPPRASGRYSLLLRKHHELRRSKDATTLLGVSRDATPGETRRALRSLVRELHPDRFDGASDSAARVVSGEVLKALVRAETELARDVSRGRAK